MRPAQLAVRLGGIAEQYVHFGRSKIARVDLNQCLPSLGAISAFVDTASGPVYGDVDVGKGPFDELAYRRRHSGRQYIVVRSVLLQHQPDRKSTRLNSSH